ncbi:MAG: hypothetical protein JRI39_01300 [Deltaproteobacteria bacterium]|nr:hypothetical protein [Deltaproteobacteria bacterium]
MIMRLKAEDERGQPLFTEYIGGMMRGVHCAGEGKGKEALPVVPKPPNNGNSLWEQEIQIGPLFPYIYDGCTDIVFPIHTSPKFARQVGLPGIIVQGTATLAFAAREIVNRNGNGDPTRLREISCRFRAMVRPDTNLTVRAKHLVEKEEYDEIFFEALNGDGDIALSNGYARIRS